MTTHDIVAYLLRFWRVAVIGLLAGLLAFMGSFVFPKSYMANTTLLVRSRDSTLLTSTGERTDNVPVIDTMLAKALSETQSALVSSEVIATVVVEELGLDVPVPKDTSIIGRLKGGFAAVYGRSKAILVHGEYIEPSDYDRAVAEVQAGLTANQLNDSYVLQVTALADDADKAVAIANTAADALIELSETRFRNEAARHRDLLGEQVTSAAATEAETAAALREFKIQNDIANVSVELNLNAQSRESLRTQAVQAEVELGAVRAELRAIQAALERTSSTSTSESAIETGRSTTVIAQTGVSTVYDQLRVAESVAESKVASAESRLLGLQEVFGPSDETATLSSQEAELSTLSIDHQIALAAYTSINELFEQAVLNTAIERVELSRLDQPIRPTYPVSPKRYLYLAMGLVTGAVAGLVLTALAAWRRGESLLPIFDDDDDSDMHGKRAASPVVDLVDRQGSSVFADTRREPERVSVGAYEVYVGSNTFEPLVVSPTNGVSDLEP